MAKLKDFDLTILMNNLRTFEYEKEGVSIIANIFPQTHAKNIAMILESKYGDLKADDVFYKPYSMGLLSDSMLASTIADKNHDNWVHLLGITKSEYNPIWNVDGTVETTTETEYGKNTTLQNGLTVTTEQTVDGKMETIYGKSTTTEQIDNATTETTYGKKDTTEQLTDGSTTTTHGLTVTNDQIEDGKETNNIAAFNSSSLVTKSEVDSNAGKTTVTNSGDDIIRTNIGKTEISSGGKDSIVTDAGKIEVADNGTDTVNTNAGKMEVKNSGEDVTRESGKDTQKVTEKRGGNIGVTMTQQLLTAESDFWSQWNFFDKWFKSIVEVITIPVFEED